MKKKFEVSGMSCAACQANVTRAVSKLDGVHNANVSLLAKNMVVDFDESKTDESKIIAAVDSAGYGASPFVNQSLKMIQESEKAGFAEKKNEIADFFDLLSFASFRLNGRDDRDELWLARPWIKFLFFGHLFRDFFGDSLRQSDHRFELPLLRLRL
jgi:copper chaperone CopZ